VFHGGLQRFLTLGSLWGCGNGLYTVLTVGPAAVVYVYTVYNINTAHTVYTQHTHIYTMHHYTVYTHKTDTTWIYTVVREGRVVIITSDYRMIRKLVPKLWMDTSSIPDRVWL
jgi:hypothetical protein